MPRELDDYNEEGNPLTDDTWLDVMEKRIDADEDAGTIDNDEAERLREDLEEQRKENESERGDDWPTENMDPDEDTPFGTGD